MEDLEYTEEQVERMTRITLLSKVTLLVLAIMSFLIIFFGMYGAYKFATRNQDREFVKDLQRKIYRTESLLDSRNKEVKELKDQINLLHQSHDMENLLTFLLDPDQKDKVKELDKFVQQYKALQEDKLQ